MCGIAGYTGDFEPSLLEAMQACIRHRGPDDRGTWADPEGGVGLAHTRLSIIDLSDAGRQPMWDADQRAAIVFNGEIYNFRELRSELEGDGFQFRNRTDTEVLLNLYLRDGPEMLQRVRGMFAFAIWDPREGSLLLARDQMGIKPLYWARTPKGILFASELKALLQEPSVDRTLDLKGLQLYTTYLWAPSPFTMLESVRKLEPGAAMRLRDGRVERAWSYWDIPYGNPVDLRDEARAAAEVRGTLASAVDRQLVADVEIGAFLSGGLDSSSVAVQRQKANPEGDPFRCFTIEHRGGTMEGEGFPDDLPFARRVAREIGADLHSVVTGPEIARHLPRMIWLLDEPQADLAPINAYLIAGLARERGIKVLLSGTGGDDVFSGYRRHHALMLERYWRWIPGPARSLLRSLGRTLPGATSFTRRASKLLSYADLPDRERLASYFFWQTPAEHHALYSKDVLAELGGWSPADPLLAALDRLPPGTHPLNRMLYLDAKFFLPDHNLNYTDKMAMAHGVEVRVPLIDLEVVELATRIAPGLKQHGRHGKYVLKKAMEGELPRDVLYRPKTGFAAPVRTWLHTQLGSLTDEALSEESIRKRGLFDPGAVRGMIEKDRTGAGDFSYTILSLISVELWCRTFLDASTPSDPGLLE